MVVLKHELDLEALGALPASGGNGLAAEEHVLLFTCQGSAYDART
jgi:hypothetical protein